MKNIRGYSLIIRILALITAVLLLIGAVPVSALEGNAPTTDETVVSEAQEATTEGVTEAPQEPTQAESGTAGEKDAPANGSLLKEKEKISPKAEKELAATAAELPDGVEITVDDEDYLTYEDYYFTGMDSIKIRFVKPKNLAEEDLKAVFDQDITETEDFDKVDWWDNYSNLKDLKTVKKEKDEEKKEEENQADNEEEEVYIIELDIKAFVKEIYLCDDFADGKADGVYTLVFPYDVDSDGKPILYSQDYLITTVKPEIEITENDADKWISTDGKLSYKIENSVVGVNFVQIWQDNIAGDYSYESSDTFTITESGNYYIEAVDYLGQRTEKIPVGEFKIDRTTPVIDEAITYEKADPDTGEWTNEPVEVTFKVSAGASGVTVTAKETESGDSVAVEKKEGTDDEYGVTFTKRADVEVAVKSGTGKTAQKIIVAPQIDTVKPDKTSISHIGFSGNEKNKILNLLSFGIYGNKELQMTVYTKDVAPITEIEVDNESVQKLGEPVKNGNETAQTFVIPTGKAAQDSNFADLSFKLTDAAGNKSSAKITWSDIRRFTLSDDTIIENTQGDIKELINTKIAPDIPEISVDSEQKIEGKPYYHNKVKISADISEPMTGLASAKAYFGTEDDFTYDEKGKEYKPKDSAKDVSERIGTIRTDAKADTPIHFEYSIPDEQLPSGKYLIYFEAVNNSGNTMQKVKELFIDKEAPVIELTSAPEKWANEGNEITFTVTDRPVSNVGVGAVTVDGKAITADENGIYHYQPQAGKDVTIAAKDNFDNKAEDLTIKAKDIKFDDQKPSLGKFNYDNDSNTKWRKDVTVTFTADDLFNGTTLSGVDTASFVVTKKDSTVPLDIKVETKALDADTYECSFKVPDNNTAYTVAVKDHAGNVSEEKTTDVILRDNSGPEVEKIVFNNVVTGKKFGVYGKAVEATVYMKSGCAAPVINILLKDGDTDLIAKSNTIEEISDEQGTHYKKSFYIPVSDENNNACKKLGVYAESAAGVPISKNAGKGNIVNIADINVYVEEAAAAQAEGFFEAVSKTTGPAIEIDYQFTADRKGSAYGYHRDENGDYVDKVLATFNYTATDDIAGVNDGSITVYYDTKDHFILEKGEYKPDPAKEPRKIGGDFAKNTNGDNEETKNTQSTGTYEQKQASESGTYILCVTAMNLSGAESCRSVEIDIDNTAPVIGNDAYRCDNGADPSLVWVNEACTVSFTVTDLPESKNGGVDPATVTVTGVADNEAYDVSYDEATRTYSFAPEHAQAYHINAKDVYGAAAAEFTTKKVLVDTEKPHISIPELKSYQDQWTANTKEITFDIDDLSDYDGFSGADKELSGIVSVTVKDKSGKSYAVLPGVEKTAESKSYSFTADQYNDFIITVKDAAGNEITNDEPKNIAVDNDKPYVDQVSFTLHDRSITETILNFVTFGIYAADQVDMTVTAKDNEPSSKLKDISVSGIAAERSSLHISGGKPSDSQATAIFVLDKDVAAKSTDVSLKVQDESGLESSITLAQAYSQNIIDVPADFSFNGEEFELVISGDAPSVSDPVITPKEKVKEKTDNTGTRWFSGDVMIDFDVEDTSTYLHSIDIEMNDQSIRDKARDKSGNPIPATYTVFDAPASAEGNETTPVKKKHITVDSSTIGNVENKISQNGDGNSLHIVACANNGLTSQASAFYQIDDVAPDITAFEFSGAVNELTRDQETAEEKQAITDALAGTHYKTMTTDNYIYFFREQTEVTVSATDTHTVEDRSVNGSGVKEIHFYTVGSADVDAPVEVTEYTAKVDNNNFGDMTAKFTVKAGFKGSIFAYAVDQVDNTGSEYSPNNLVAENKDLHDASSGIDIDIETDSVGTDNNDHPLYDSDVDITFTVEDLYSGIRSVSYSCIGLESNARLQGQAIVNASGEVKDNLGSWNVKDSDRDRNLVLKMSRSITLDGADRFNSNDIVIKVSGYDCSGYLITEETKIISIDTTDPEIEVTYSPAKDTGNHYGTDEYEYFKVSRTMNVTVKERNFDPSDFDYSGIVNKYISGNVPKLVEGENWSTDYTDYTGAVAHTCSFTFDDDGDYEIALNCKDEAGNKAKEYTGEKFTIDTIDPVISVSLSGSVQNGKYYSSNVTATITVHEHNFAEGNAYVAFKPQTGFDNSYDKSNVTPSLSGWSGSGDTHYATVNFSSDGTYTFTFNYRDKALRMAKQYTQSNFVIDKNIDKLITFIEVEDETAYDAKIMPKVNFKDTNLDTTSTTLTRISLDTTDMKQTSEVAKNLKHEVEPANGADRTDSYDNFPNEVINDGIYELEATGTDLAGNTKTESIIFSVNRFGSTFMLGEQSREWLDLEYVNTTHQLDVIEINVNEVKDQSAFVTCNSHTDKLKKKEFKVTPIVGDSENWYRYQYTIFENNFEEDGDYTITVSSTDSFKRSISNRTAANDEELEIERTCPITFTMDTEAPIIQIDGVKNDTPYGDRTKTVNVICADANIDPESLVIKDGGTELRKDVDYTVEQFTGDISASFTIRDPGKHSLSVTVADKATNGSSEEVTNFELNASLITLFFHNTAAIVLTIATIVALIALAVYLVLKKKKKEQKLVEL